MKAPKPQRAFAGFGRPLLIFCVAGAFGFVVWNVVWGVIAARLESPKNVKPVAAVSSHGGSDAAIARAGAPEPEFKTALQPPTYSDQPLVEQARRYEIDLIALFDAIRERCLPEWGRSACNHKARAFLAEKTQEAGRNLLLEIYDQNTRYEDYIATYRPLEGLEVDAMYATLQKLREQFFAPEVRAWMFGPQDARMRYEAALQEWNKNKADHLSENELAQQKEALKKAALGEFYPLFHSMPEAVDAFPVIDTN
ncbi:hypothetical protein HDN1F_04860 [gamma proteobacterium HdN1]|nr:hypothetical protein HDN1F_04860 [gamma proteobacterium HdN1]